MKKVLLGVVLLLFCLTDLVAQRDFQMSQYVFFPAAVNPAFAGEGGMMQVAGMHRMDFLTAGNGVQTTNVGVNMPFGKGKHTHGAGVRFVNMVRGSFWSDQNAYLQYAYKYDSPIGRWGVGVDLGFFNSRIDGTKTVPKPETPSEGEDGGFHEDTDEHVPQADVSGMSFDLNLGVMYAFKGGYAGVSVTHVTKPKPEVDESFTDTINTALHVMAAYEYKIPDTKLVLKPHTLLKTNFIMWDWNVGALLEYNEKLWGGLSYRWATSVGFAFGMNVFGGLSAGVVYDLPTTRMINTVGSVELTLQYNFEILLNKHDKKYKSIRIL